MDLEPTSALLGRKATVTSWTTYELAKAYHGFFGKVVNVFNHGGQTWVGILTDQGSAFDLPASCFTFDADNVAVVAS